MRGALYGLYPTCQGSAATEYSGGKLERNTEIILIDLINLLKSSQGLVFDQKSKLMFCRGAKAVNFFTSISNTKTVLSLYNFNDSSIASAQTQPVIHYLLHLTFFHVCVFIFKSDISEHSGSPLRLEGWAGKNPLTFHCSHL